MNDADYKINSFLKQEIKVVQELKGNLLNSTPGFPFDHEMEGSLNMLCCPKDISEFSITLPSLLSEKTKLSVSTSLSLLIYTRKQKLKNVNLVASQPLSWSLLTLFKLKLEC